MADADIALLTGWIALVLGEADALRAKGVTSIGAAGCTATFAARPPDLQPAGEVDKPDATVTVDGLDALNDPHSYPAGVVPGYDLDAARRARSRLPVELDE